MCPGKVVTLTCHYKCPMWPYATPRWHLHLLCPQCRMEIITDLKRVIATRYQGGRYVRHPKRRVRKVAEKLASV